MKNVSLPLVKTDLLQFLIFCLFSLSHSQKKKTKRRKKKKNSNAQVQNTPEALEETWQIVSQELRASGFQVCLLGFASLSVEVECTGLYLNECHKGPWFADSSLCFFYFMRISGLLTCMNLCARNFKCCNYKMAHHLGLLWRLLTLTRFQRNSGISILGSWHFGKKEKVDIGGYWFISFH